MKRVVKIVWRTVEVGFIVLFVFLGSLFFREQGMPANWVNAVLDDLAPTNLLVRVNAFSFGVRHGLHLRGLSVHDRATAGAGEPIASAASVDIFLLRRRVVIDGATYKRLPASYYAPENHEKNARVEGEIPVLPRIQLILTNPDILAVRPARVEAEVSSAGNRLAFEKVHLDWANEPKPLSLDGFCEVDLARQRIRGEVRGHARQSQIRPMLVALDVPVSLPYVDAFTEVTNPVPSFCGWNVNLVNNDFDLELDLHPTLGRYNGVPLRKADGNLKLHVYTRGECLNYHHTFGPILGTGAQGEKIEGTVVVDGLNRTNTVRVVAKSALPIADLLRIGGFTGEYVGRDVVGDSSCELEFRFPRAMTNNYELLNGRGRLEVKNGQLLRMKGFQGLVALMAEKVPGVSWFTDCTQASGDYIITNGVVRTENGYIEGSVFSIKMFGDFDSVHDTLDYSVRVQFAQKDSWLGKVLHPLAWPFTKLATEFTLTGSPAKPVWKHALVDHIEDGFDAVKGAITGGASQKTEGAR